jgi:2-dehydro-3-deoxygluconokinase
VLLATLPQVDWFLPSLDDVQLLSGLTDPDGIVDWCHAHGARQVVLKLGAQGCIVSGPGLRAHVPAFSVDVVDATGAGDCFDGALLTQLNAGIDLHRAARYACGAAALATTGFGAVAPLPRKVDVDAFLQAHPTPQCQMQGLFSDTANG